MRGAPASPRSTTPHARLPRYPADRVRKALPPPQWQTPPWYGSRMIFSIEPPVVSEAIPWLISWSMTTKILRG